MRTLFLTILVFGLLPPYGFAQMSGGGTSEQKEDMKHHGTMMDNTTDDSHQKLHCAEQWLKKAIQLHELHMKDTTTATNASQMEMMVQMKKAYECISGTVYESKTPKAPNDVQIK